MFEIGQFLQPKNETKHAKFFSIESKEWIETPWYSDILPHYEYLIKWYWSDGVQTLANATSMELALFSKEWRDI